jgi:hypothetical protein
MSVEHRGGGAPERDPTPSEAKRPDRNQPTLEVEEGRGGVPPPPGEQAKPQQESATNNPTGENKIEMVVFDCAVPEVIPSPFHIRRMLRDEIVTEEQAQELEQRWLGKLKTMGRRSLEGEVRWWEMMRDRFTKEQKQEEVKEIEQQLEVTREQLRQRGGN